MQRADVLACFDLKTAFVREVFLYGLLHRNLSRDMYSEVLRKYTVLLRFIINTLLNTFENVRAARLRAVGQILKLAITFL